MRLGSGAGSNTTATGGSHWFWAVVLGLFVVPVISFWLFGYEGHIKMAEANSKAVVVIGGGLAGLTAAYHAAQGGARVVLVDKEKDLGGNSKKATSGINGLLSKYQIEKGEKDSFDDFFGDVIRSGKGLSDPGLAGLLVGLSGDAIDSLAETGMCLSDVQRLGGHSAARTHRLPADQSGKTPAVGFSVVNHMKGLVTSHPNIEVQVGMTVVNITMDQLEMGAGGKEYRIAKAVIVSPTGGGGPVTEIQASAVIISSGGYSAETLDVCDPSTGCMSLLRDNRPDLYGMPTTNGQFATGDLVKIGIRNGLATRDLDQVQLHPTGFVDPADPQAMIKFLCPEVVRGVGAVLLDRKGRRFVNELATRDEVAAAIMAHGAPAEEWFPFEPKEGPRGGKVAMVVVNDEMAGKIGSSIFGFYYHVKKFFRPCTSYEECQELFGFDAQSLADSFAEHDSHFSSNSMDRFGKTVFPGAFGVISKEHPFYAGFVTPALHYTMGGLKIDLLGRVLRSSSSLTESADPVANIFAAGEAAGGVHGGNRLGGNGCLESLVFGKLTGSNAAKVAEELTGKKVEKSKPKQFDVRILEVRKGEGEGTSLLQCQLPRSLEIINPANDGSSGEISWSVPANAALGVTLTTSVSVDAKSPAIPGCLGLVMPTLSLQHLLQGGGGGASNTTSNLIGKRLSFTPGDSFIR